MGKVLEPGTKILDDFCAWKVLLLNIFNFWKESNKYCSALEKVTIAC